MEAQDEFKEVIAGYREWAKKAEEEGEQWRRAIEDCVSKMSKSAEHQGGEDLAGNVKGRTQVVVEETYDADLERKQRILEDCEDNDIWMMQANTWIGICGICRVREGVWRGHDKLKLGTKNKCDIICYGGTKQLLCTYYFLVVCLTPL